MSSVNGTLAGQAAIITGGSRGLGAAIARAFWREGASVLLPALPEPELDQLAAELKSTARPGQQVCPMPIDLSASNAAEAIVAKAKTVFPRLHVLVNNAGIQGPIGKAWENDWQHWLLTIRVDLLAPVDLCRACLPWMIAGGGGRIINLSGGGATGPRVNFTAYGTAKAALVRFSETLAVEAAEHEVQVNCIAPGTLFTSMQQAVLAAGPGAAGNKEYEQALKNQRAGEGTLRQAADLCVFLAGPASVGITGKLLSAEWDQWDALPAHVAELKSSDIYTLRRIVPADRGKVF